ncbi:TauD/TfdA dioxygenase family protein [Aestuariibius sp. 2305UL40-4]|uniref:TauD/TfdA dioxygenase family protein n=1 Tax=Aestuariibius violaceus TaxID=3234132 RepID=UPI00345EE4A5
MQQHTTISVTPSTAALGACITGVDLSKENSSSDMEVVRQALLDNLVIFFPDQILTPSQHRAFARRFGPLDIHPYSVPLPDYPEILEIVKEKGDVTNFGGGWHIDMTYMETSPLATILVAKEIPDKGGDTLFANMYTAYATLSDGMKEILEGMVSVHGSGSTYGSAGRMNQHVHSTKVIVTDEKERIAEHPVVRTHPETGLKSLFVNRDHTYNIMGLQDDESKAILDFLYEHSAKPEFTYRHSWTKNSVVMWDNRCTQHNALNDYSGQKRAVHRIVVRGDKPK